MRAQAHPKSRPNQSPSLTFYVKEGDILKCTFALSPFWGIISFWKPSRFLIVCHKFHEFDTSS